LSPNPGYSPGNSAAHFFPISSEEIDDIFTRELRHQSEDILVKTQQPYQINLFSGVSHGFAVRGDLTVPQNRFAKEQAFLQALAWFDRFL
jgi:dienelactone hydrolase